MENTSVHSLADEISPLTLAFVGDGVYDLLVREYLVRKANRSVGELNKIKVSLVNCKSQAEFAKILMPTLTEKELAVYKRGRNAAPKCTPKTVLLPIITVQLDLKHFSDTCRLIKNLTE